MFGGGQCWLFFLKQSSSPSIHWFIHSSSELKTVIIYSITGKYYISPVTQTANHSASSIVIDILCYIIVDDKKIFESILQRHQYGVWPVTWFGFLIWSPQPFFVFLFCCKMPVLKTGLSKCEACWSSVL